MFDNPLVLKFIASLLRWVLGPIAAFLVARGIISAEDSGQYINALTTGTALLGIGTYLVQLGWSLYEKFKARQKQLVAQAAHKPITEDEVDHQVAMGNAPSVTTPTDTVPTMGTGGKANE